jgi:hypothetical protein
LTKRIRRRNEFLAAEDSPIVSSNCGCRGHNRQSCNAPAQQRTDLLTNLSLLKSSNETKCCLQSLGDPLPIRL